MGLEVELKTTVIIEYNCRIYAIYNKHNRIYYIQSLLQF